MSRLKFKKTAVANQSGAMEADTISKNGRSSKSHTSRGHFLRIPSLTLIGMMFFSLAFAQDPPDYKKDPQANEKVIGNVIGTFNVGSSNSSSSRDDNEGYMKLLEKAKKEYPNKVIDLRNFIREGYNPANCSAKVVELYSPETKLNETLVKAVNKALSKVNGGSRLAIDQISVSGGLNRETVKDQLLDVLLDREYRVVAKEYLEKLKAEQEQQQGGGYNERTTVKTENFSAVGYFLNVRVNEQSIRVQVINVSTGEYEGNATVEF